MCPTAAVNIGMVGLLPSWRGSSEDGELELVGVPGRGSCILLRSPVALSALITEKLDSRCCRRIHLSCPQGVYKELGENRACLVRKNSSGMLAPEL